MSNQALGRTCLGFEQVAYFSFKVVVTIAFTSTVLGFSGSIYCTDWFSALRASHVYWRSSCLSQTRLSGHWYWVYCCLSYRIDLVTTLSCCSALCQSTTYNSLDQTDMDFGYFCVDVEPFASQKCLSLTQNGRVYHLVQSLSSVWLLFAYWYSFAYCSIRGSNNWFALLLSCWVAGRTKMQEYRKLLMAVGSCTCLGLLRSESEKKSAHNMV